MDRPPIRLDTRQLVGRPLALTPDDLDLAATVTTVDQAVAQALWYHFAAPRYADLLDAVMETM
jgi:hypothetical protein